MDESNVDDTWSSDDIQPEPSTTDKAETSPAIPVGIIRSGPYSCDPCGHRTQKEEAEWTMKIL